MREWEPIPGFPNYDVSPIGMVRNRRSGRVIRPQETQLGLVFVGMMDEDGEQRQRGLARLVAQAFIPQELEVFDTPINVDGNRWNNHVGNLMWRPRWFAILYHRQFTGHRYEFPIDEPLRDLNTGEIYDNSWVVTVEFGLLEKELVNAIEFRTYVWPTYQLFEVVA